MLLYTNLQAESSLSIFLSLCLSWQLYVFVLVSVLVQEEASVDLSPEHVFLVVIREATVEV